MYIEPTVQATTANQMSGHSLHTGRHISADAYRASAVACAVNSWSSLVSWEGSGHRLDSQDHWKSFLVEKIFLDL